METRIELISAQSAFLFQKKILMIKNILKFILRYFYFFIILGLSRFGFRNRSKKSFR